MYDFSSRTNYSYSNKSYINTELTIENLEFLIKNKYQYDFNCVDEVLYIYMDVDRLLKQCNLKSKSRYIINMIYDGYDFNYIAEELKWFYEKQNKNGVMQVIPDYHRIKSALRSICKKMFMLNQENFRDCLEIRGLIKIPQEVSYKRCSKCDRDKRIENFYKDERNVDGLRGICKLCE